jgi:hypothetical protein
MYSSQSARRMHTGAEKQACSASFLADHLAAMACMTLEQTVAARLRSAMKRPRPAMTLPSQEQSRKFNSGFPDRCEDSEGGLASPEAGDVAQVVPERLAVLWSASAGEPLPSWAPSAVLVATGSGVSVMVLAVLWAIEVIESGVFLRDLLHVALSRPSDENLALSLPLFQPTEDCGCAAVAKDFSRSPRLHGQFFGGIRAFQATMHRRPTTRHSKLDFFRENSQRT